MQPNSIEQVVRTGLCSGCGVCAYLQPNDFQMVDVPDQGRRPRALNGGGTPSGEAMAACPCIGLSHDVANDAGGRIEDLRDGWGPVYRLWEGYAVDHELRYGGSSGGAASALALFALEMRGFEGVLHTGPNSETPYLNQTVISRSREELLARTGSRYSPASPCDGLGVIEEAKSPFVFIAKPCDVAAANSARRIRSDLDKGLGLTIAFFCAGIPSTAGTLVLVVEPLPEPVPEVEPEVVDDPEWDVPEPEVLEPEDVLEVEVVPVHLEVFLSLRPQTLQNIALSSFSVPQLEHSITFLHLHNFEA